MVDAAGLDQFALLGACQSDPTAVLSLRGPPTALTSTDNPAAEGESWRGRELRAAGELPRLGEGAL